MNTIKTKNKSGFLALLTVMLISMCVAGCVYIDGYSIMQVYNGKEVSYCYAGDTATFTLTGHIECHQDTQGDQFIFAILVPKAWNLANNSRVTYKCDLADDRNEELPMDVVPASELPKNGNGLTWVQCLTNQYGVGPNVLDDMEWVVFKTRAKWDIVNNQFPKYTIYVHVKTAMQNLKCHIGFFVNHTADGFSTSSDHKKVIYSSECFEVVNGKGATIDFCNNHYNKVSPLSSLQNDFVTLSFMGDVASNKLANSDVYVESSAFTNSGKVYSVTEKSPKTLMKRSNEHLATYKITIWPVDFFKVPHTEYIDSIQYQFTNKDRSVVIDQSEDDYIQLGTPIPAARKPFKFEFSCE